MTLLLLIAVVLGSSGKNKGFGFVRFSEETDQQRALIEMQHMTGIGRNPIRVSLAQPKGSAICRHLSYIYNFVFINTSVTS